MSVSQISQHPLQYQGCWCPGSLDGIEYVLSTKDGFQVHVHSESKEMVETAYQYLFFWIYHDKS